MLGVKKTFFLVSISRMVIIIGNDDLFALHFALMPLVKA